MHAPSLSESESVVVVPVVVVDVSVVLVVLVVSVVAVVSVVLDVVASVSEVEVPVAEVEGPVPELVGWPLVLDIDPFEVSELELSLPAVASPLLLALPMSSPAHAIIVRPTSAEIRTGALLRTTRCGVAQNGQWRSPSRT